MIWRTLCHSKEHLLKGFFKKILVSEDAVHTSNMLIKLDIVTQYKPGTAPENYRQCVTYVTSQGLA